MENWSRAKYSKRKHHVIENYSEIRQLLARTGKSVGNSLQNAIESAKTGKPISRRNAIIVSAAVGGAALAGLGVLYLANHLPSGNSTSNMIPTSATTTAPQINQDQIQRYVYLANQTVASKIPNADIINPFLWYDSQNNMSDKILVGDILKPPQDWSVLNFEFAPSIVDGIRTIKQGALSSNASLVTNGVQKINDLALDLYLQPSSEQNDVRKSFDLLNSSLASNDAHGIADAATVIDYQVNGIARESYPHIPIIQSQTQWFFDYFYGGTPSNDPISKYSAPIAGKITAAQPHDNFWDFARNLVAFTVYEYESAQVAQSILNGSLANKDAIIANANSSDPFVSKWSSLFTPDAIAGYMKVKQAPGFDSALLDRNLTQDPYFWSGELNARLSTISRDPKMLTGFADGWNWYGKRNYTTLQQIMRHRPLTSVAVWAGPNPSDITADMQSFETLKKEAELSDFNFDSYSVVDPSNGVSGDINNQNELLLNLRRFLRDRFSVQDDDQEISLDAEYTKLLSFSNIKKEYDKWKRLSFPDSSFVYRQLLLENIDSISKKFGQPLTPYCFDIIDNSASYETDASAFIVNNKFYHDSIGKSDYVDLGDFSEFFAKNSGYLVLLDSCFHGNQTFFDIQRLTDPYASVSKYDTISL
jgi:hypothetical protein